MPKKRVVLFFVSILTAGSLTLSHCDPQSLHKKKYYGWLTGKVYINRQPDTSIKLQLLVYGNYLLEPQYTHHAVSQGKLKTDGSVEQMAQQAPFLTLDNYFLFNLKNGTYTSFNTNIDSLYVLGRRDFNTDKPGFQVKEEVEQLKNDVDSITSVKDTVINKQPYKILEKLRTVVGEDGAKRVRFLLNASLKDFPFHPVSAKLDKQYGGTVLMVEYIAPNGWTLSTGWHFSPELDKKDKKIIQRFISLAEHSG